MLRCAQLEATRVEVNVRDNKVTLNGCVNSWIERGAAERAAWSAPALPRSTTGWSWAGARWAGAGTPGPCGLPMRAMSQRAPGAPLSLERLPTPRPGPGQVLLKVGMRRLPHGSARGGRRAAGPAVSGHARTRGDRHRRGDRRGASTRAWPAAAPAPPGWPGLAAAAFLPDRTREPLRCGGVHRLYARRRLCVAHAGRKPHMCIRCRRWSGRIHGAVDVRRPDRLARAARRLATPAAWACTGSARPGRRWRKSAPGNIAVCMPTPDPATPSPVTRAHAGRGLEPATAASTRRNPGRGHHLRARRRACTHGLARAVRRADASCAAYT